MSDPNEPSTGGRARIATRVVALGLTLLTGCSGLVYEVAWEKYLATLLGAHSEATAALLGLYLGGLAIGYSAFGALARRLVDRAGAHGPRLLFTYGLVEVGIGLYAIAFPSLFQVALLASSLLPAGLELLSFAFDVLLCGALIAPPAILMGGTIPLLTQGLSGSASESTRVHAMVYGFNTLGAFGGALGAGFYLIPTFGLVGTIRSVAVINLVAGCLFGAIGLWRGDAVAPPAGRVESPHEGVRGLRGYLASALLLGFAMMTVQVVVIRIGALSFGASQFTFSIVVAVFVLCIGLGSLAVSCLPRIPTLLVEANPWLVALLLCGLDPLLERATYGAHVLRTWFSSDRSAMLPFHLAAFGAVLCAIGPAVILSGATLPLLFHRLRDQVADLGRTAGRLYGWNTFGSLLGALLSGYLLLFWLDLDQVYRLSIASMAICGTLLGVTIRRAAWRANALALVGVLLVVLALPGWRPELLLSGLFRHRERLPATYRGAQELIESLQSVPFVFHTDDPVASIGVGEHRRGDRIVARTIVTNGKSDGNTDGDYPTMGLLGALPGLLAEHMERAFVVGFGTGVTAAELAALDTAREVVVAEISPGIVEAAPYFDFANMNASTNPRIRIERRDAFRALLASTGSFDVIVSEPSNPWVAGVEMLFSVEFLRAARDRLRPGGVHCQWFHLYETNPATLGLVLRTYAAVFDRVAIWYGRGNDLLLLGFGADRDLDLARIRRQFDRPDVRASFARAGVDSFAALLGHELAPSGVVEAAAAPGPIHSLLNPLLGYTAARGFFSGETVRVPFSGFGLAAERGRRRSLWRRYLASLSPADVDAEYEQFAGAVCANRNPECVAAIADWQHRLPDSQRARRLLEDPAQSVFTFGGSFDRGAFDAYRDAFIRPQPGALELAEVRKAVRSYRWHYFHAAAPPRDALVDLWKRCDPDRAAPGECEAGLARARRMSETSHTESG